MPSPRSRNYFITINQSAESYDNALSIIQDMNVLLYALIVHDKDQELNEDGTFVAKKTHKHICLELKNAITFASVQKKLPGAHIEIMKYQKASYQYLVHNSPNSKEKYQYDVSEIISNRPESVKDIITSVEGMRFFNEYDFLSYLAEGITTEYQFAKVFGLKAYREYWKSYLRMLKLSDYDEEMKKDVAKRRQEIMDEQEVPF